MELAQLDLNQLAGGVYNSLLNVPLAYGSGLIIAG